MLINIMKNDGYCEVWYMCAIKVVIIIV